MQRTIESPPDKQRDGFYFSKIALAYEHIA